MFRIAAAAFLLAQAVHPTGRPVGVMAMKPVVCKAVEEAKGKSGAELAQAIETVSLQFSHGNYALAALLPGDPPIACYRSLADSSKLPMGAR